MLQPFLNGDDVEGNEVLSFFDGRVNVLGGQFSANLGWGFRNYVAATDSLGGIHFWYDADNTRNSFFQQIGGGVEARNDILAFNANGYLPVGDKSRSFGFTPVTNVATFSGRNLLLQRFRLEETAMTGFDAEAGFRVPGFARPFDAWAYLGYYQFDGDGVPETTGVTGRFRTRVTPAAWLEVMVTNDDARDTLLMVGMGWEFGRAADVAYEPDSYVRQRIGTPVRRYQHVAITDNPQFDPVVATDPTTGNAINVVHVNSAAAAGGNGTFEAPFHTLTLASNTANSSPNDIIFVAADSVFTGETMTLQANQRFLGEGGNFTINTAEVGMIPIPRVTSGTAAPVIQNSPNTGAIVLANGTEVAGFTINNSTGPGIVGDGVSGTIQLANTSISNTSTGIDIRNSSGTFTIDGTPVNTTTGEGIVLTDNTGTFTFNNTTSVSNAAGASISIQGGSPTVTFNDISITNRGATAISIGRFGGTATFNQNLNLTNPNGTLSEAIGISNSTGNVTFADVTIDDSNRATVGLPAVQLIDNTNIITFGTLSINATNGGGLLANRGGTLSISDGVISSNGGIGVDLNAIGTSVNVTLTSVSTTNASRGIQIIASGTGNFTVTGDGATAGSGGTIVGTDFGARLRVGPNVSLKLLGYHRRWSGCWT